jgi:hypothetical protein
MHPNSIARTAVDSYHTPHSAPQSGASVMSCGNRESEEKASVPLSASCPFA